MTINSLSFDSLKSVVENLKSDVINLFSGERFVDYLTGVSSFYNYSPRNIQLIQKQLPTATCVASFVEWNRRGYRVKKGSKGIKIICPIIKVKGEEPCGFTFRHVFDISQVERIKSVEKFDLGEYVPLDIEMALESLMLDKENPAIIVEWNDLPYSLGSYSPLSGNIKIRRSNSITMFKTLLHEKRHAYSLGNNYYRFDHNVAEVIAEASAYIACLKFGITSSESFSYIGQFCENRTAEELDLYLTEIVLTSRKLIKWVNRVANLEYSRECWCPIEPCWHIKDFG